MTGRSRRKVRIRKQEGPSAQAAREPSPLGVGLALAFGLSGVAGLVYELTWTRYLALLVGHSAFAQVLVLAVFLGGTAAGSFLVAERSRTLARPLLAYALVEAALGAIGIVFHLLYRAAEGALYGWILPRLGEGAGGGVATWTVAVLLILPQSLLLGTTFPLMAAGVVRRRRGAPARSVADVYLLNTLGGAAGVLIGGFVLVPALGLPGTAAVAGALNLAAAALAYRAGKGARAEPVAPGVLTGSGPAVHASIALLLAATFFSALASFVYEIAWIRMLALVLGSATHAFELMLSAFLLGLAAGSLLIRGRADRAGSPVQLLGRVQFVMGAAALLTLFLYAQSFPVMARLVALVPRTDAGYLVFNLARYAIALVVMLPATLLAGMTLPLITGTMLRAGAGERIIGQAYGANTAGSVIGAVAGGLVLLPGLGLEGLLGLGAGLDLALGVVLLAAAAGAGRARALVGAVAGGGGALLLAGTLALVRFDQAMLTAGVYRTGQLPAVGNRQMLYYADGATATVGAHRLANGTTVITTNGKADASLPERWLRRAAGERVARAPLAGEGDVTTQLLAPLITLAHAPGARRGMVIGHGSGMSSQVLLGDPGLESLVTVEIEPEMLRASQVFDPANRRPFADPRARFVVEDARRAIASGGEPLDLIISEPSNPWISGVASLFTVEFYEHVRGRLAEGGVFGQWMHLYEMEDELVFNVLAAIERTFPDWSAYLTSAADMVIVAGNGPLPAPDWSVAELPGVKEDLELAPPLTAGALASLLLVDHRTLGPMLDAWPPNTDARPRLDARAEHARFMGANPAGLFTFADHPVDLTRILSRIPLSPLPYESIPILGIVPLERRALAGWLAAGVDAGTAPALADWEQVFYGLGAFTSSLLTGPPPDDWSRWLEQFLLVEGIAHGRAAGWVDANLYGDADLYLTRHLAPSEVRAAVELFRALRALDLRAAADAADRMYATEPSVTQPVRADVLLDAAVAAYLGSGQPAKARAAFDALAPRTQRPRDHVRTVTLDALVGEALGGAGAPLPGGGG